MRPASAKASARPSRSAPTARGGWPAATLAIGALALVPLAVQKLSPVLQAVVDVERAFARATVERGQRDAFLTYLAEDGITFTPHPGPGKDAIRKRPDPANPTEIVLNWAPMTGGASSSGDMGFTTGPYIIEDRSTQKRPPRHGIYFTVWKKGYYVRLWTRDPGQDWKILLETYSPLPAQ